MSAKRNNEVTETTLRRQLDSISVRRVSVLHLVTSNVPQIQFIASCWRLRIQRKPRSTTVRARTHTTGVVCERRILKVCFTKLRRGGRIFSFSPLSGRCVFQRERERERGSGAVQARSFHYHSEKALHETLPGKQGRLPSYYSSRTIVKTCSVLHSAADGPFFPYALSSSFVR